MSRLAKKPISEGNTLVSVAGGMLTVKGAKGTLTKRVHPSVAITVDERGVHIEPKDRSRLAKALTGTFASHVKNMAQGVETPYVRKLIMEGVGYKMEIKGKDVVLTVGFSHTVPLAIPEDVTAKVEKNVMTLESPNKESVGQFAANVRRVKPPEPYLGKGIRYEGEVVRRKQGKKAV
ncbi:50S ribosomal protein L6 [Candidatus Kaiserbacteria bacterium RIFCSPHIGHO2_02_FULL_54_22]|uniref:50S ribosomal protein L6 n=1 Tax=Candidatus Kaiserbacteria bacterium RIFCSPHIGHO2_02_FULL_54_22 TaxID=1798495 RepID=A0A1F6DJZ8_9BACT|nr:MAG: 50S ribosomal protein L6 [Parcubacteria group bacterium GW2011_GWA1_54_9]KKW42142.1 MAG: 50S ribosomal protein L6 [Parcubacteria group bacterium GW2011_GWB1_55_9]OGG61751.1 MAG: 50S ribosomal protein L6 [Candidatus Kaiserbacteria bacterium RIFCSPHIGHO2_02_FULL_54_22]OGG68328.1 MAG: 50S ribosomal protein L6 [Candidatus Kaiserbacteria bacterium RIFCSPHIGHO2_12_FULL_54_16]OGG89876.1 MAG: 50S ribosomal protein L6 [Candidatus Kaiserbacteria bacterium RIFCSPLOWO2_12_FULL_54_10]